MRFFNSQTILVAALVAGCALASTSSSAAILRSSNGMPVLTKDGNCVITNWEGSENCDSAKAAVGMGTAVPDVAPQLEHMTKAVYFDFGKSGLSEHAKHHLDHLAHHLNMHHRHDGNRVLTIIGYADRIGNADYNQKLALNRAKAVRAYLVSKGIKAKKIEVRSLGKTNPKAECSADLSRAKLIDCLREDRRVEIEFGDAK